VKQDNFRIMVSHREFVLPLPHGKTLALSSPLPVMGALGIAPNSLSTVPAAKAFAAVVEQGQSLLADGATILNIGGDLDRPGVAPPAWDDDLSNVASVVGALSAAVVAPICIETASARIAAAAIEHGASIINDAWGFQRDQEMARVAAATGTLVILSHNRANIDPDLDIIADIIAFLSRSIELALTAGVEQRRLIVDPAIGSGKTAAQDLESVRRLDELNILGCPILLGEPSTGTLETVLGRTTPAERAAAALATATAGVMNGAAMLRVHDVAAHVQALQVLHVILSESRSEQYPETTRAQ
jgi:dihydropteroate synthase